MSALSPTRLLAVLGLALCGAVVVATAADLERTILPGDEVDQDIGIDEVHAYRLDVVSGTSLDIRLEGEAAEEDKWAPTKDSLGSPVLALLDPSGEEVALDTSNRPRIRVASTVAGRYVIEVRAASFAGRYSLHAETELPSGLKTRVTVSGDPEEFAFEAPVGASVRLDIRRVSGNAPDLVRVLDGAGRDVGFTIKSANRKRLKTYPIPVTSAGGLRVLIDSVGQGGGSYNVRVRLADDMDDLPEGDDDRESRRIVVTLVDGADASAIANQLGYTLVAVRDGYAILETPEGREGREVEDARDADDRITDILGAEPDARLQTPEGQQSNKVVLGSALGRSDFEGQPALQTVNAPKARRRATGRSVVVAVLDTGIDRTHPLFDPARVLPGRDFVDGDTDPSEEMNGIDDDGDGEIDEGYGHGTFVAGLVLATAPDATILPVRVLDDDSVGSVSDIAAGLRWAVDNGADVINLSLGARVRSQLLRGEVRYAQSRGVHVVAATGNRFDPVTIDFPAGLSNVIAVSAVDSNLARAPFANAGGTTTVGAPGTELIGPYPGGAYVTWSGTSFSAALVSGAVASVLELRPTLRVSALVRRTRRAGKSLPRRVPAADRKAMGGGLLDMKRLVR